MKLPLQFREFDVADRAIDKENRTISFSVSSREPVTKFWGTEILSHDAGAIITKRLDRGAVPFLRDHNRSDLVGKIIGYEIKGDRMHATAKLSRSGRGEETLMDIADEIRTNISVGYIPHEAVLKERSAEKGDTYLVTKWEPVEISTVSIPADSSIGIGRSGTDEYEIRVLGSEVTENAPVFNQQNMPDNVPAPSQPNQITTVESPNQAQLDNVRDAERARVREILQLGERHGFQKQAEEALYSGKAPADFRAFILDEQVRTAEKTAIGSNPLGMNPKEVRTYSLCKAIRQGAAGLDGLEREASNGLERLLGRQASGFYVPDVALMPLNRDSMLRTRDLSAGIAAAGGVTIELAVEPTLIQYLRNKMVLGRMGAVMLGGLTSNISLPRQTGPGQAYWLAENAPVTSASQTFDQVGLSPKRLAAQTAYSKQLVAQSSLDIENIVRDDILSVIALAQDEAGLYGTGITNNQPAGLLTYAANAAGSYDYKLQAPSITFGGPATWKSVVQMEGNVEDGNVDLDETSGYVTTPLVKATWKTTPKAVNYPVFLWEKGSIGSNEGEVNGYRAIASKQVKNNTAIFGKWRDCIVATWSGLDMITDPLTLAGSFQIKVIVNLLTDINFRYLLSFCSSTDAANQ
jgi:HK97 family phage major capsid protein